MKRFGVFVAVVATVAAVFTAGVAVAGSGPGQNPNGPDIPLPPTAEDLRAITPEKQAHIYHPITPCRVADTRQAGGVLTNGPRDFKAAGDLTSQGGAVKCGIPSYASAVAMNITALSANGGSGFVRGWAKGGTPPNSTLLNWADANGVSNMVNLPVSTTGFVLRNFGSANLVIDALGYYAPTVHALLNASGGIADGSPMVLASTRLSTGSYRVQVAFDPVGCTPIASINGGPYFATAYVAGGYIYVSTYSPNGSATDLSWTLSLEC